MNLDLDRYRALVAAEANARDAMPSFELLQSAQGRWSRARSDLEIFRSHGAVGQASARHSADDIAKAFERGVRELEGRLAAAEAEMSRIDNHAKECAAKRSALHVLVEGVRAWARAQNITLPGDDASMRVPGFGAAALQIAQPPAARPFPGAEAAALAPRQGNATDTEPPASRAHRGGGGIITMMQRVWP